MADSVHPWLVEYLVNIAEQFGGNLSSVPRHARKKKAQMVEVRRTFVISRSRNNIVGKQFLTYGMASQDDCLWARLSDKSYKITVRFTKTALEQYTRYRLRPSPSRMSN